MIADADRLPTSRGVYSGIAIISSYENVFNIGQVFLLCAVVHGLNIKILRLKFLFLKKRKLRLGFFNTVTIMTPHPSTVGQLGRVV